MVAAFSAEDLGFWLRVLGYSGVGAFLSFATIGKEGLRAKGTSLTSPNPKP